ncbi:hypothetical protein [Nocardioides jishulii]|uniref:Uncharacterized protein n=1 Tax=Nocardioides jishulii TaxID=2575440 RepID=A0A4U2YS15_9ACTN|nr:hypothetical protein [Nocardioides jishulii]QCX28895.1 hypothetical protein FCL41_16215 [Nocardioides jishulii]TKI64208.1 hypothetical protein FC770_03350 [Nocardioides jishulii]
MTHMVDKEAIAQRKYRRSSQDRVGIDLWVTVPGLDRHSAADLVAKALAQAGDTYGQVLPTSGGTYVWLASVNDGAKAPDRMAAWLAERGHDVRITVAPVDPTPQTLSDVAFPAAVMAYALGPAPLDAYPDGRPKAVWGLDPATTARLLREAAAWVAAAGRPMTVGRVSSVPVTAADAAEVTALQLQRNPLRLLLAAWPEHLGAMRRLVRFDAFGRMALTDLDRAAPSTTLVDAARDRLVEAALELDYGCVRQVFPGATEFGDGPHGYWRQHPGLWGSHIPDAQGIQLLNLAQLERASDLTGWHVRPVAPDRFLVEARDLDPWFAPEGPPTEVLARARADFGAAVLPRVSQVTPRTGRTYGPFPGDPCRADLFCPGDDSTHWLSAEDDDEESPPEPAFVPWHDSTPEPGQGRVEVDWTGVRGRARHGWVDLRVTVEGVDRRAAAAVVEDAVAAAAETRPYPLDAEGVPVDRVDVRPTAGGTWMLVNGDFSARLAAVVAELERSGVVAHVGPSEVPTAEDLTPSPVAACTVMSFVPEQPFLEWDRRPGHGGILPRWGVAPAVTRRLLTAAVAWTGPGSTAGVVQIPYTTEDALDVLTRDLEGDSPRLRMQGQGARVEFHDFATCGWAEAREDLDPFAQAAVATDRLLTWVDDITYGAVVVNQVASPLHSALTTPAWIAPHLLSSRVPEVQGIQLLTGAHLSLAHDLSDWDVEPVAPGRYLVRAKNLEPWLVRLADNGVITPREVRAKARADFGEMVMTMKMARNLRDARP